MISQASPVLDGGRHRRSDRHPEQDSPSYGEKIPSQKIFNNNFPQCISLVADIYQGLDFRSVVRRVLLDGGLTFGADRHPGGLAWEIITFNLQPSTFTPVYKKALESRSEYKGHFL